MTEQVIKHNFLCCNQETYDPLIWKQYGYWSYDKKRKILYPAPEWATRAEVFEIVEHLVKNLKESNLQIEISNVHYVSEGYSPGWACDWVLFDPSNPHIEGDKGGVCGCKSEQDARNYAMQRYRELKYLYDGDIEALLVYRKTGIACLPNWNHNEIDSWGFKEVNGKIVKSRIPRASEVKTS
ncbi:hypothetical protein MUP77_14750 [Candidatus Bathyarchaeota archaeon]|nr:hypothetical protein [Candidatus Bathyarchaeota archaeon]